MQHRATAGLGPARHGAAQRYDITRQVRAISVMRGSERVNSAVGSVRIVSGVSAAVQTRVIEIRVGNESTR